MCKCHCHNELRTPGVKCRCIKNCIHCHPENFQAEPVKPEMVQVSCNKCGAGKKLYWSDLPEIKQYDAIVTKALFEKTDIKSALYVHDITKGCPKCGGELTEEL